MTTFTETPGSPVLLEGTDSFAGAEGAEVGSWGECPVGGVGVGRGERVSVRPVVVTMMMMTI